MGFDVFPRVSKFFVVGLVYIGLKTLKITERMYRNSAEFGVNLFRDFFGKLQIWNYCIKSRVPLSMTYCK